MVSLWAVDWEWVPNKNIPLVGFLDRGKGRAFQMQSNVPFKGPNEIDGLVGYFIAPNDVLFTQAYVHRFQPVNIWYFEKVLYNRSEMDKTGRNSLEQIAFRRLGIKMGCKVNFQGEVPSKALIAHCKEDTRTTWKLFDFYMRVATPAQVKKVLELEERNKAWYAIAQQHVCYDSKWLMDMIKPEIMVTRLLNAGIDFFVLKTRDDGKVRMTINRRKFQEFLRRENFDVERVYSNAPYAEDNELWQMHWMTFEAIARSGLEPRHRELAMMIYVALRAHYAQSGESRFGQEKIYPLEITCAQDSGRVSHIGCPVSAGVIFRMAVIPPPGMKTLVCDIKSQELMLSAEFSGDEALKEACLSDVYSYIACLLDGRTYEKMEKNDPKRNRAKSLITLPYIYGVSWDTMHKSLVCEPQYARMVIDRLDRKFHKFWHWRGEIVRAAFTAGYVETLKDKFPLQVGETSNPRQVVNHCVQGTAADMLRTWVTALVEAGFTPFATLHDGLYIYVPKDMETAPIRKLSEDVLNKEFPIFTKWTVETAEFHGHLVEKGDEYLKLVANLSGTTLEEEREKERLYCEARNVC